MISLSREKLAAALAATNTHVDYDVVLDADVIAAATAAAKIGGTPPEMWLAFAAQAFLAQPHPIFFFSRKNCQKLHGHYAAAFGPDPGWSNGTTHTNLLAAIEKYGIATTVKWNTSQFHQLFRPTTALMLSADTARTLGMDGSTIATRGNAMADFLKKQNEKLKNKMKSKGAK